MAGHVHYKLKNNYYQCISANNAYRLDIHEMSQANRIKIFLITSHLRYCKQHVFLSEDIRTCSKSYIMHVLLLPQSSSRCVLLNSFPLIRGVSSTRNVHLYSSWHVKNIKLNASFTKVHQKIKQHGMQQTWNIGTYSITKQVLAHRKAVVHAVTCISWSLCTFVEVAKSTQHPNKNNVS